MNILAIIAVIVYLLSLLFIFSYSIVQLSLVITYLRKKVFSSKQQAPFDFSFEALPVVTVQLPVFNEVYVVSRLLDSIIKLDYPKNKLQIQVLDDSTDETTILLTSKVTELQQKGYGISHIRRADRKGFKAGALSLGLESARGEFIAIFDSDFTPGPDFLLKVLPHFQNDNIGVVQTRWDHLNKDYSLLTRLQAFGLDAHFTVEQTGRSLGGHFINFNGTAGVWRKSCIVDAGGWRSDTLTEDLDLSYRAQLKGWKFYYLEEVGAPAELPIAMNALKNQQFRWNKGAAECAKKFIPQVLKKKNLGVATKLHAAFHLMNSTVFIFIMMSALLSIPMLLIKAHYIHFNVIFLNASLFLVSLVFLIAFYLTSALQKEKKFPLNLLHFLFIFPLFLAMSMGLALHNAVAVLQGYFGMRTPFKRTPKFNIASSHQNWKNNKYLERTINWMTVAEGFLALYFISGIIVGIRLNDFGLLPFHVLLAFGFGIVCLLSILHSRPALSGNTFRSNEVVTSA